MTETGIFRKSVVSKKWEDDGQNPNPPSTVKEKKKR
jgi:hypothetical protein